MYICINIVLILILIFMYICINIDTILIHMYMNMSININLDMHINMPSFENAAEFAFATKVLLYIILDAIPITRHS